MSKRTDEILVEMGETYKVRNAVYGSNYRMVGPIMALLFPRGVPVHVLESSQFHLFELTIVKLSRLAISELKHVDSARDAAVYCAMIEAAILEMEENNDGIQEGADQTQSGLEKNFG